MQTNLENIRPKVISEAQRVRLASTSLWPLEKTDLQTQKTASELGSSVEGHLPNTYMALDSILALTMQETRRMARVCVSI